MSLIVMKFGGSSVGTPEKILTAAERVVEKKGRNNRIVAVVSAPGDMTDDLIEMADKINPSPSDREMDMLLSTGEQVSIALLTMAITKFGKKAISLTGPQAGIFADTTHTKARILTIEPKKIVSQLKRGQVVIVAGFQGLNPNNDIATLGRGGSDLTAVALAAVLKADVCEIYTDVDGIYTADPRLCRDAVKIAEISYDEMLELAGSGAQVMQSRSIEVAKKFNVTIHVRSTFSHKTGTIIKKEALKMEDVIVSGVAYNKFEVKLSIEKVPDQPGVAACIFSAMAKAGINVDMIIQSAAHGMNNDISFTIPRGDLRKALPVLTQVKKKLNARSVVHDDHVSKVSIVGVGMRSHPGVAARMFTALSKARINIEMISTSEIRIACIVKQDKLEKAVKVLHKEFKLNKK
ncbi:MAG: aspartate kinase [bacterium]